MDPTATLRSLVLNLKSLAESSMDEYADIYREYAIDAAEALTEWLRKGGYAPTCIQDNCGDLTLPCNW